MKKKNRILTALLMLSCGASVAGLLPSCETTLTTFNPCGTVFAFCEPEDVLTLFADIPDFSMDPTCTIPFYGIYNDGTAGGCSTTQTYNHTPGPRPEPQ